MGIPYRFNPLGIAARDPWSNTFDIIVDMPAGGSYTFYRAGAGEIVVSWGDGSVERVTAGGNKTHTYSSAGTRTIKFFGTTTIFWPAQSSAMMTYIVDCNWNWNALPNLISISYLGPWTKPTPTPVTYLPKKLSSGTSTLLGYPCALATDITELPDQLPNLNAFGNSNSRALFRLSALPKGLNGSCYRAFRMCSLGSYLDIGSTVRNAPKGGFPGVSDVSQFGASSMYGANGSIAEFMRLFPNVTKVTDNGYLGTPFNYTVTPPFLPGDHFEIKLTTTSASQEWGFTPRGTHRWYVLNWGDNTSPNNNVNLKPVSLFTSVSRVAHTYANAGTYTISLAMDAESIEFDHYDSDNGLTQYLGDNVQITKL